MINMIIKAPFSFLIKNWRFLKHKFNKGNIFNVFENFKRKDKKKSENRELFKNEIDLISDCSIFCDSEFNFKRRQFQINSCANNFEQNIGFFKNKMLKFKTDSSIFFFMSYVIPEIIILKDGMFFTSESIHIDIFNNRLDKKFTLSKLL